MKRIMKINSAFLVAALATSMAHAAPNDGSTASQQLQVYPKNLARQNVGANLLEYNPTSKSFAATKAAAAWLDDDVATGWPAPTGQHYYMIALPEPQLLTNFAISTRAASGTVSIYAGDEAAAPSAKSWNLLAKDVSVDSINQKLLANPFSRFAKYFLIETNLSTGGPWYSIYLYGEKPAVAYHLQQRAQPVNPTNLIGPYSNSATAFNMSSLYAHSHVAFANTTDTPTGWQKAIDDNPETATSIAPSKDQAGLVIRYDSTQSIQRISVLTDGKAKGKLEFFLSNQAATVKNLPSDMESNDSRFIKASNEAGLSPAEMKPVATIKLDGADSRGSADFAPVSGSQLIARWTPDEDGQLVAVREVNSFGSGPAMSEQELVATDDTAEDLRTDPSKDAKDFKNLLPVGEAADPKTAFIPGVVHPPPNIPLGFSQK